MSGSEFSLHLYPEPNSVCTGVRARIQFAPVSGSGFKVIISKHISLLSVSGFAFSLHLYPYQFAPVSKSPFSRHLHPNGNNFQIYFFIILDSLVPLAGVIITEPQDLLFRWQIVKKANSQENPLSLLPSFTKYTKNGLELQLETIR
jgi:hypothetical protein